MISKGLDTSQWGESAQREWNSLSQERNPQLHQEGLLALGRRWVRQDRIEPALRIFHFLQESQAHSPAFAAKVAREIDAIEGRGSTGARVEFLLRRFAQEATHPALLAGMATGSAVFQLSRTALLGRLLSSPVAGWATRGFGARALAGGAAFALEAPAFVAAHRGVGQVLGDPEAGKLPLSRELAGAYLMLGGLKLFAWGGEQALRQLGGGAVARASIPQLSAYLGLLAGRGLEHGFGLNPISSRDTLFTDALATLLQFRVGGELSQRLLGARWRSFQNERNFAAENTQPPLPDWRAKGAVWSIVGAGGKTPRTDFLSARPYAVQGRESQNPPATESSGASLKIRWVPEGLPRLHVEESRNPVNALVEALESHLKKVHPHSVELHYQGRMIGNREQDQLKERMRRILEDRLVPDGFLAAIAFLKGMPKMALIYTKEEGRMNFKFTQLRLPDTSSSSPSLPRVAPTSASRTVTRVEEIPALLGDFDSTRNPHIHFEGAAWNIRDAMRLAAALENSPHFPREQTLTLVLREKSVQLNFGWELENGVRRVAWKTLPIDRDSSFALPAPIRKIIPAATEAPDSTLGPSPLPTEKGESYGKIISCQDRSEALEAFLRLLTLQEGESFQTPPIEMRRGELDAADLGLIAEILQTHPLPVGRKISIVWVERPSGLLKVQNEGGRISAEIRSFGSPIQNYLLKPEFESGLKRFVRTDSR